MDVLASSPVSSFASVSVFVNSAPTVNAPVSSPSAAVDELLLKLFLKYAFSLVDAKTVSSTFKFSNSSSLIFIFVGLAKITPLLYKSSVISE